MLPNKLILNLFAIGFLVYCNSMHIVFSITTSLHYCFRVSEDADISPDEDDDRGEDKYEDSFIDDQTTPTGQFTQSGQGGEYSNTNDMMAFYRY